MTAVTANEPTLGERVRALAAAAKAASRTVGALPGAARAAALHAIADALHTHRDALLAANARDMEAGRGAAAMGELSASTLQRLALDDRKLEEMASQLRAVAAQDEPLGRVLRRTLLDHGLELRQVSCPIGVVAAIFEARPDAVTQIAALALRSGNAVVLKPGREVRHTARALMDAIHDALATGAVPPAAVAMLDDRAAVDALLGLDDLVDLVVPRGSQALVRSVMERSRIPVLGHAEGVCHLYLDASANREMAVSLTVDAKVQYPAACNSIEVVLVHRDAAAALVPPVVQALRAAGVTVGGCPRTRALVPGDVVLPATPVDWRTEWGDLRLTIGVVDSLDDAIAHVNAHGSHHTDAIVTADAAAAEAFLSRVDSACVFHNASTRFADGYRFGLGAELGIGTGKLHARGPVGLEGLTTYKHVLSGQGQLVAEYAGRGARPFRHVRLPVEEGAGGPGELPR